MKLKSGKLLWPDMTPRRSTYPRLSHDIHKRVVVVGAGITGAIIGWHLAQAGIEVAIIDQRRQVCGSTPASTALLMYEIDVLLTDLGKKIGVERAQRAYARCHAAIRDLQMLMDQLDERCDLQAVPSLYLAKNAGDTILLRAETAARREIGISARYLTSRELQSEYQIERAGAILSTRALQSNPYQLALALLKGAANMGADIFTETTLICESLSGDKIRLRANNELIVEADHVIFATGYETPEMVHLNVCDLLSTYAIATSPIDPSLLWRDRALIWEHDEPYLYARTTPDNRIVAGGEDEEIVEPAARDKLISEKSELIRQKLQTLFPKLELTIDYAWAGTFATTDDGLPYIGAAPNFPRAIFALGYGGNGITFSLIAAQIISRQLAGQIDPDADIFSFHR
jgi:glycine/D-amino acid oxidase-like deaminating enzyme